MFRVFHDGDILIQDFSRIMTCMYVISPDFSCLHQKDFKDFIVTRLTEI